MSYSGEINRLGIFTTIQKKINKAISCPVSWRQGGLKNYDNNRKKVSRD
jgi:hypothetical protein